MKFAICLMVGGAIVMFMDHAPAWALGLGAVVTGSASAVITSRRN